MRIIAKAVSPGKSDSIVTLGRVFTDKDERRATASFLDSGGGRENARILAEDIEQCYVIGSEKSKMKIHSFTLT